MNAPKDKGFSATNTEAPNQTNNTAADFNDCLKSKQVPAPPGVRELTGSDWEDARRSIHRAMVFGAPKGTQCTADFEDAPDGCVAIRADDGQTLQWFFVIDWHPTPRMSAGKLFAQVQKIFTSDESCERMIQTLTDSRMARRMTLDIQERKEMADDLTDEFSTRAETCAGLLDYVCEDLRNLRGAIPRRAVIFAAVTRKAVH